MDYLHSMAPKDEELLNCVLDGEPLAADEKAHLEQCEICQQRLANYTQVNAALKAHLYRSQCPDGVQLSLYCANLLLPDDRVSIATHLLDCPLCAAETAQTRRFMAQVEPMPLSSFAFSPSRTLRRIVGTLVRQQAQLVLRNGEPKSNWPRQYRAESLDLSLHLTRASSGEYMLLGILTSADNAENVDAFEGARADIYPAPYARAIGEGKEETPIRSTVVDDLGNIVFSAVPVGNYTLIIHLPDREVVIEGLPIEHG